MKKVKQIIKDIIEVFTTYSITIEIVIREKEKDDTEKLLKMLKDKFIKR